MLIGETPRVEDPTEGFPVQAVGGHREGQPGKIEAGPQVASRPGTGGQLEAQRLAVDAVVTREQADDRAQAQVALLVDWDAWQVLEHGSQPHSGLRLMDQVGELYQVLWRQNILVEFVTSRSDLLRYKVVLVPSLPVLSEAAARHLKAYVAQGGHLVMSYFSGVTDQNDHIHAGTDQGSYNPLLRDLLGLRIEEFDPQLPGAVVPLSNGWQAGDWCDVLELEGAVALARYTAGSLEDRPAVTRHAYGRGTAYHLGTQLRPAALADFLSLVLEAAQVSSPFSTPEEVEAVVWADGTTFLINHGSEVRDIPLSSPMFDLLEQRQHSAVFSLRSFEVAVLQPQPQVILG